jgi:hypothetical protein
VVLSTLDRRLAGSAATTSASTSSAREAGGSSSALAAAGPAGCSPSVATEQEMQAALRLLLGLCIAHPTSRAAMASGQYARILTDKALQSAALAGVCCDVLLAVLGGSPPRAAAYLASGSMQDMAAALRGGQQPEGVRLSCMGLLVVLAGGLARRAEGKAAAEAAAGGGGAGGSQQAVHARLSQLLGAQAAGLLCQEIAPAAEGGIGAALQQRARAALDAL